MYLEMLRKAFNRYPMLAAGTSSGSGFVDGSEDDDPSADDDGEELKNAVMVDEEEEESEEPKDDSTAEEEKEPEQQQQKTLSLSQEELDEIVEKRLARERRRFEKDLEEIKSQQQKMTQAEAEKKQRDEWDAFTKQTYDQSYSQLISAGYDEQIAKAFAQEAVKNEITRVQLQQEQKARQAQEKRISGMLKYSQQKSSYISKHPLVAKYVEEIDEAAQNGEATDFETAANYVLGKKVISGEIQNVVRAATEQKTLKNIEDRKRVTVENAGLPGKDNSQASLTREEKKIARAMGIPEADYLAAKPKSVTRVKRK